MNKPHRVQAIDVHAHYGLSTDQVCDMVNQFMSAGVEEVTEIAEGTGIVYTLVSPLAGLFTSEKSELLAANLDASEAASQYSGILHWIVVNPLIQDTYAQAKELLSLPGCIGIKIHPEQHNYRISDHGDAIFAFAAEHGAVVQSHSGQANSLPMHFVEFADRFPEVSIIISHLGNSSDGDPSHQVRAIQKSKHRNLFTDTSSSRSITPNLIEWAVREIGSDRILFGTDSPLYFAPMQRARIDYAGISEADKRAILRENALRLFSCKPGMG